MATRHDRLRSIPHMQASEVTFVDMPAQPGVGAFRQPMVTTACGIEIMSTLTTRTAERVRCKDCRALSEQSAGGQ